MVAPRCSRGQGQSISGNTSPGPRITGPSPLEKLLSNCHQIKPAFQQGKEVCERVEYRENWPHEWKRAALFFSERLLSLPWGPKHCSLKYPTPRLSLCARIRFHCNCGSHVEREPSWASGIRAGQRGGGEEGRRLAYIRSNCPHSLLVTFGAFACLHCILPQSESAPSTPHCHYTAFSTELHNL